MAVGARRWDAVALLVDPGGWPVLVCQRKRAVRRAAAVQGRPKAHQRDVRPCRRGRRVKCNDEDAQDTVLQRAKSRVE